MKPIKLLILFLCAYLNAANRMIRVILIVLIALGGTNIWATDFMGVVIDENKKALPYSTVRIRNKGIAFLGDSTGVFSLSVSGLHSDDTISISYLGYETKEIPLSVLLKQERACFEMVPATIALQEVTVVPTRKIKRKTNGKKHSWALMRSYISDPTEGECFGYEFHSKKNRRLVLDKVGFFFCDGDSQMTKMKFRINVYDMSGVKKSPSNKFVSVSKPIYFEYRLGEAKNGKFEYKLQEHVVLPKDAMVEIEFLENLNGEIFWFKSNLLGKRTWAKSLIDGEWEQNPFATPFFVECVEIEDD